MTDQHLWHPFADMARVPSEELTLVSGEGSWVTDAEGRRYLDASAALWFCNVGHGRSELADAAAAQMRKLAAYHTFDVFANEPALELARRLALIAPTGPGSAAFFTSGGSEAIDTAAKLARRYWHVRGEEQRRIVIARDGAYHGMAAFGTSLAGIAPNRAGWGPLVEEVVHVEADSADALADALERHSDAVAGFIGEPVLGAGGVHPPAPGYWERVQALCREHDVLLIVDEVVTGFGRLGTAFACERYGIAPDLLCAAKGISSGYAPLGVVLSGARVRDVLWHADAGPVRHGYTYSGHATACAVALANLDVLEREALYERVRMLEPVLADALRPLAGHPLVADVRTVGLLAGVELDAAARAAAPDLVERVVRRARARGVLVRNLVGQTLQISPPFVIDAEELTLLAEVLRVALDETAEELMEGRPSVLVGGDHRQTA
ncbi:MAG: aspartate aminotransferase family protein [Solirubrobacteraceae bacterium]